MWASGECKFYLSLPQAVWAVYDNNMFFTVRFKTKHTLLFTLKPP